MAPYFIASLLSSLGQLLIALLYNVAMAPLLGLHRLNFKEACAKMDAAGFGSQFTIFGDAGQTTLRHEFAWLLITANALEQVESQWCPIRHLAGNPQAEFPEHHRLFVERSELCELRKVLVRDGSVSARKPKQ